MAGRVERDGRHGFVALVSIFALLSVCVTTGLAQDDRASADTTQHRNASAEEFLEIAKGLLVPGARAAEYAAGVIYLRRAADEGVVDAQVLFADMALVGHLETEADPQLAATYYQLAADAGDAAAMVKLANLYRNGAQGLPLDAGRAFLLFKSAADLGDSDAKETAGVMLVNGEGVAADASAGLALIQEVADGGDSWAYVQLGEFYRSGTETVARDAAQAFASYRSAVDLGNSDAKKVVGDMLVKGEGVAADASAGLALIQEVADGGDSWAYVQLGEFYRSGTETVARDAAQAFAAFKSATDLGNDHAKKVVGDMLVKGEGVAADAAAGIALIQEVADGGDSWAYVQLGELYRNGTATVARDSVKAFTSFKSATDLGNDHAKKVVGDMLVKGEGVAADADTGLSLIQDVAEGGDGSAYVQLGGYFRSGTETVTRDAAQAYALFSLAADLGNTDAKKVVGDMLVKGEGVAADADTGLALILEVAAGGDSWAYVQLGDVYRAGTETVPRDAAKAFDFFRSSSELGNDHAKKVVGDMLVKGEGVAADADTGLALIHEVAVRGDSWGYVQLGDFYRSGAETVIRDAAAAFDSYRSAADLGNEHAMKVVGDMLIKGEGVAADADAGLALIHEVAVGGDSWAYVQLGDFYRSGTDTVPRDAAKAFELFRSASELGNDHATKIVGDMLVKGEGVASDADAGLVLLQAVADVGDGEALAQIGDYLAVPDFGLRDVPKAITYYERASAVGNNSVHAKLGDIFRTGAAGVTKSANKAVTYYRRGVELGDGRAVEALAAMLSDEKGVALEIYVKAANAPEEQVYEEIASDLAGLSTDTSVEVLSTLGSFNSKLYVYLVQSKLSQLGLYEGAIDGLAGGGTMRAISTVCEAAEAPDDCAPDPKGPAAIVVLARLMSD